MAREARNVLYSTMFERCTANHIRIQTAVLPDRTLAPAPTLRFEELPGHSLTPVAAHNKMHYAFWVRVCISSRFTIV
jgi:hypothetical protein